MLTTIPDNAPPGMPHRFVYLYFPTIGGLPEGHTYRVVGTARVSRAGDRARGGASHPARRRAPGSRGLARGGGGARVMP